MARLNQCDRCKTAAANLSLRRYGKESFMNPGMYSQQGGFELCKDCADELRVWLAFPPGSAVLTPLNKDVDRG